MVEEEVNFVTEPRAFNGEATRGGRFLLLLRGGEFNGTRPEASPSDSRSLERVIPDLFAEADRLPTLARGLFCSCSAKYSRYPLSTIHTTQTAEAVSIMKHPIHPKDTSHGSNPEDPRKSVNLWFAVAVIGLFLFACFYTLKVAVDLFLPIVLAAFLGFLLTPVTRWLRQIGLSNFWAPLLGTLGFLTILICLFAALCVSVARFEPGVRGYATRIIIRCTCH